MQLPSLTLVPHDIYMAGGGGVSAEGVLSNILFLAPAAIPSSPNNDAIKLVREARNESLEMFA